MYILQKRLQILYIGSALSWTTCIKPFTQKYKQIITAIKIIVKIVFIGARYG